MDLKASSGPVRSKDFWVMCLVLGAVITLMLGQSFLPGHTLFSNDGPLGRLMSQCHRLPDAFTGVWEDLNTIGYREQGALPNITYGLRLLLKPIGFSKFYVAAALMILGLGAWSFFRQSGLAAPACALGGLAAILNSEFFSTACWGVAAHPLTVGMSLFAMALLLKGASWRGWVRAALAGLAVGMGLSEGADVGVIFSVYVAAFAMYQAWIEEGPRVKNLAVGAGRVALVAGFAAFLAAQAISVQVNTQIEGVSGMAQDEETRQSRWDWATQWSLPKTETLSLAVPGLFGYRMDTTNGGFYWGSLGRDAEWRQYLANGQQGKQPTTLVRQTGSGIYAGVSVILVALWAALQALRKKDSVFSPVQRRWLWFWLGVALVSLVLGYGRFAPFYRMLYALPYFSTIRNPVKFLALVNLALVVLFAYGVDGLWRKYLAPTKSGMARPAATPHFDKSWMWGCLVALGVILVAWVFYASSRESLQEYLQGVNISEARARQAAEFSISQVGWFVFFFVLTAVVMAVIFRGGFAKGGRGKWGIALLGLVLVADLGRADQPWIIDWDYQQKYASNPVLDILREKPYEARVALEPLRGPPELRLLDDLYHYEWAQQQFQYYNIQSLDIVQLPRMPQDIKNFQKATHYDGSPETTRLLLRRWELTNTRYLMCSVKMLGPLREQFDPDHRRFRILQRFDIVNRPDATSPRRLERLTAELAPEGDYAIFEFTGWLPRAKLYANWQVNTNSQATLDELVSPAFDPAQSVLVAGGLSPSATVANANQNPGTVDFTSYAPKDVVLQANAKTASVLLLNDRFDPNWKVLVDGQPAPLLRCNYIMRGVHLEPGAHRVEFKFEPPVGALFVSLAAVGVGVLLLGVLAVTKPEAKIESAATKPAPVQQRPEKPVAANLKPSTPPKNKRRDSKARR